MAENNDTEKIYLAALRNQDLSDVGVKQTQENIELYWRMSSDIAKMRKAGTPLSVPN